MVVCTYNPSCLRGWGRRITWTWEVEVAVSWDLATVFQPVWWNKTPSQKKIIFVNISQVWGLVPVVLAPWEAEVEGSLEPRILRLQCTTIEPLHSSPGNRARPVSKIKNNNNNNFKRKKQKIWYPQNQNIMMKARDCSNVAMGKGKFTISKSWKRQETGSPLELPEWQELAFLTSWLYPSESDFVLLTSRTMRE